VPVDDIKQALHNAFKSVHDLIIKNGFSDGTAALVMYATPEKLIIANSGDQRAVLCSKNGKAEQITYDHKPDAPLERKRITECGGFVTEDRRVNGILALSRAIGDTDLQPHVTFVPDIYVHDITDEDDFIVLACDGLWDVISNEDCARLCGKEPDPAVAATKLRDYAHCMGSTDNISTICYKFKAKIRNSQTKRQQVARSPKRKRGKGKEEVETGPDVTCPSEPVKPTKKEKPEKKDKDKDKAQKMTDSVNDDSGSPPGKANSKGKE